MKVRYLKAICSVHMCSLFFRKALHSRGSATMHLAAARVQALAEWYRTEGPKLTEKLKARGEKAPAVKSDRERQKLEEHAEWDFLREQGVDEKNLPALTSQAVRRHLSSLQCHMHAAAAAATAAAARGTL